MIALALLLQVSTAPPPYKDRTLPIESRVQDLLQRMTPEEKFWQLYMTPGDLDDPTHDWSHGVYGLQIAPTAGRTDAAAQATRINLIQRYFVERTRLGIPIIPFDEALHGLARPDATAFPQAIALAATWDPSLMEKVATAIAWETRGRGIRQVLSPMVNIASDVRWGRTEESYGEDQWLATRMGEAFVRAFERAGVVATPKHLVANVGEGGRDSYPIEWNDRELRERFLPPFAALLRPGGARSVMSAYNSVNGLPATQNPWLLTTLLRNEWGFTGVAISDAAATGGATVLQMTEEDTPSAARHAWEAGLDVVFQSTWAQHRPYLAAVLHSGIAPSVIDSAVARVLRLKFALGLFEAPYVEPEVVRTAADRDHPGLARRAAEASMVLLKNAGAVLPLRAGTASIAVIGTDALEARLGGYSGTGTDTYTILDGIRDAFTGSAVRYAPGPGRLSPAWTTIPASALGTPARPGLDGAYFTDPSLGGAPTRERRDSVVDFAWTLGTPGEGIAGDWYGIRWTGTLRAPAGLTQLGVEGDDGYRLWLDGRLLIDRWTPGTHRATLVPVRLAAGTRHTIKLEFHTTVPNARVRLIWDAGADRTWRSRIAQAVALARRSAVAVVVAGIEEGEFRDRSSLALPGHQEELIRAVAATGRPTIVILIGGSAITMSRWLDDVEGVVMAWYPGQEGGAAVGRVLAGQADPGGRLPITFPVSEGQLPLYYDHRPTGRGDDYLDGTGEPLFPFGFGLSYTTFAYSDLRVSDPGTFPITLRFRVTNTGTRAGTEVPQLYIHDEVASLSRPVMQLRGARPVHLAAGEGREIEFPLSRDDLSMLDRDGRWVVEPGTFRLMIGASSKDIRLQERVTIR